MGKKILKVIIAVCIIALVVDLIIYINTKNSSKMIFKSLNAYTEIDNNYYGVGSNNDNKKSYEKATLIKYNSNYKEVFKKEFKSKYNSTYFNIKEDGKYLLAVGSYEKTKDENKDSLRTGIFVKYDLDGNIIFKKELQILGNSKYTNVLVLDDSYIVVGQSIYPNTTLGNETTGGAIIEKYSKDGKLIWKQNVGGAKSGLFNDVILVDKYLYVVGKDATRYGLVVKFNLDGEQQKAVSYGKTDTLGFTSIIEKDGYFYVVGAKKMNEKDEYDHDTDALIIKYNKDLEVVKEQTFKERKEAIERFNKVIIDGKNLVVIGHDGILDKKKSTKNENVYYYNSYINIYNTNLKLQNKKIYSEFQDNYFTDITIKNNKYLISGYYKYNDNKYKTLFAIYDKDLK